MKYPKKCQSFTKASLISIIVVIICIGLSIQVIAQNPVVMKVVDENGNSTIQAISGNAEIFIGLENVEDYYNMPVGEPPYNPEDIQGIKAIQFALTYDPSKLSIDVDGNGVPDVVAYDKTKLPNLEPWPVYAKIVVDEVTKEPVGELNIDLGMNPADPVEFRDEWYGPPPYTVDPPVPPDDTIPPNQQGIYALNESGLILKIGATCLGESPGTTVGIDVLQDRLTGEDLAIFNENLEDDQGNPIGPEIPVNIVGGTVVCGPEAVQVCWALYVGLNGLACPVEVPEDINDSYKLLSYIGTESEVAKLQRIDASQGTWETTSWFFGTPSGKKFAIRNGEGYLVSMKSQKELCITGPPINNPLPWNLFVGLNIIGLPHVPEGATYTSYDLLPDIGNESEVAKLQRIDASQGTWETTSWFFGAPSGKKFPIERTGGYLASMKVSKPGWTPPPVSSASMAYRGASNVCAAPAASVFPAAAPSVSNITVTDVTPTAFSVVWGSNQPGSTCTLNVFTDEAGT
ncbi:hypothetical protein FJZ31_39695, partial [Candidatus Poribacteria bacterium]|nr:hypothetical protein [Candidatus Poribacteria bacterium]